MQQILLSHLADALRRLFCCVQFTVMFRYASVQIVCFLILRCVIPVVLPEIVNVICVCTSNTTS
jgi:hypothetical protein